MTGPGGKRGSLTQVSVTSSSPKTSCYRLYADGLASCLPSGHGVTLDRFSAIGR